MDLVNFAKKMVDMAGVNRNFDDFLEQKDISISAYIRDSDNDGSVFGKLSNITVRISDFQNLYEEYQKNVSKWSFIVDEENQNEYYAMISNTSDEVVYVLNTISNRVRRRRDFEAKVLEGNGFRYSLNEISKENILLMMALIEKFNNSRDHFRHFERSLDLEPDENIVDAIIRQALNFMIRSGNYIFRIHSNEPIDAKQFNQAYINYRFNHAYFTGETLVRKKYELHSRSPRRGGVKSEEKPPLKDYNPTLVEYYTHALSTTEEMSQFLSFYHVLEYFFETESNNLLVSIVKEKFQSPMFDVDDVEDVKRFATDISKQIKLRNNNEVVGKEKNAIKQVVWKILGGRKYELDKVLNNNEVNREYYAQTTNVLGGKVKGISNFSENKDFQNIAERIYQVRNLVVHSTEASMGRGLLLC